MSRGRQLGSALGRAEPNTTSAHEQAGRLANQQLRYLQAVYQIALGTWRDDFGIRYEIVLQRQRTDVAGVYLGVTERGIAQVIGWRGGLCGVSCLLDLILV